MSQLIDYPGITLDLDSVGSSLCIACPELGHDLKDRLNALLTRECVGMKLTPSNILSAKWLVVTELNRLTSLGEVWMYYGLLGTKVDHEQR